MRIALLCGGPSPERGISLNSARSVLDHVTCDEIEFVPVYFDDKKNAYKLSCAQLYCNTPSDFDFKLKQTAKPLAQRALIKLFKKVDLVFPVIHGAFGEDGELQALLEAQDIPFVGSGSQACKRAFDKFNAHQHIQRHGFFTMPTALLKIYRNDHKEIIEKFFVEHNITRAVVKPAAGGSSIGVFSVTDPQEAFEKATLIFSKRMDTRVVIEQFASGVEFTVILLENRFGLPVALPPTEIETDYTKNQIFDFRRKYLPTRQVIWHCPPQFDDSTIERIQAQAEQLFALFGMHDFARFDGWVLPDGTVWFSDFNPVSGMEQNSFLFQQASRIGFTHTQVLRQVISSACRRYGHELPKNMKTDQAAAAKKKIAVLFGGATSERQVSLMSGTNVWLKLRGSNTYEPQPFLLDRDGSVWHVPYHLALNHTVEEIAHNCKNYDHARMRLELFERRARLRLGLLEQKNVQDFFEPTHMTFEEFIKQSEFVFNALHGGAGEDGTFQAMFEKAHVAFSGPGQEASRLCMDKWATSQRIRQLKIAGVTAITGTCVKTATLLAMDHKTLWRFWRMIKRELGASLIIVKPRADGCSTGVVCLCSSVDLQRYIHLLSTRMPFIPQDTFKKHRDIIEMPTEQPLELIFERFIQTDTLRVKNNTLKYQCRNGLLEMTIGVVTINGIIKAFNPSITVAEGEVLTVEEKFQGGTGVNITPPPVSIVKTRVLQRIKERVQQLAGALGITGYSRIDMFVQVQTGDLLIIEVNTLPALTPSTVLYHQAFTEPVPRFPRNLLELLIENKLPANVSERISAELVVAHDN
jgi:D-alanine--D-alanine ligase